MEKYNELIQALRCCATPDYCCPYCPLKNVPDCVDVVRWQAVDAIEELSRQLEQYHKYDSFLYAHGMFTEGNTDGKV